MGEAELFLVRVWQHADGPRAAVQEVGSDQAQVFIDPLQLGRYLMQAMAGRDAVPPPAAAHPMQED